MSSDNAIYILKTQNSKLENLVEYRVAHAQAIDNIYWDHDRGETRQDGRFTPEETYIYFKECQPLYNEGQALSYAQKLTEQYPMLEYGICILDHSDQVFQTFTDEEIEDYDRKSEETLAAARKQRDEEAERKRNEATTRLSPGDVFHATRIVGYVLTPDGERVYGQLSGEGVEEIRVGASNGDGADFLPNDWDRG